MLPIAFVLTVMIFFISVNGSINTNTIAFAATVYAAFSVAGRY